MCILAWTQADEPGGAQVAGSPVAPPLPPGVSSLGMAEGVLLGHLACSHDAGVPFQVTLRSSCLSLYCLPQPQALPLDQSKFQAQDTHRAEEPPLKSW